jgi:hypothetical protein
MSDNHPRPYNNVTEVVGGTPMIRLNSVTRNVPGTVYAKCEFMNPGGSLKDRIGLAMVEAAEREGAAQARRGDRRSHQRQYGNGAGDGRGHTRLPLHLYDA